MKSQLDRFRRVLGFVTDGHFTLDDAWRFVEVSRGAARCLGRRSEELIGQDFWQQLGAARESEPFRRFDEAQRSRRSGRFEAEWPAGSSEWYDFYLIPREGALDVLFRVITRRKAAEVALQEAAEQTALALEIADLGTWQYDEATGSIQLDARSRQLLGLRGHAHRLDDFLAIIHAEDRERVRLDVERALDPHAGGHYESQHRIVHPDGRTLSVAARGRAVGGTTPPGRRRFFGTVMDTTAHVAAAEVRRSSEARQAYLLRLSDALRPLEDPEDIQFAACRVLGEELRVNRVMYVEVIDDVDGLVRHDYVCGVPSMAGRFSLTAFGEGVIGVLRRGDVLVIYDAHSDPRVPPEIRQSFDQIAVRAGIATSLIKGDRLVAAFSAHDSQPRAWSALDLHLLQETADRTWAALERARAELALRALNAQLAEADQRKDEFIAILSHELRNPLAPIRYALPLLGAERISHSARRAVAVIDRQVGHLARLLDDLLDLSRISRGRITLRREYVSLSSALTAAIEEASPSIASARHEFDVRLPTEPIWLHADPARIAQIVANLLNNSAKYTPRGGRVALEAGREGGHAVIRVRDSGVGIPAEKLATVFEMFRQVSGPGGAQGGLGIGLSLARRLTEMHGGTIEARSAGAGHGAEFIVTLPTAAHVPADLSPETPPAAPAASGPLKVLIVDDNADLVETLGMVVKAAGHQVRKALDGRSALSAAISFGPDVVVLDLGLPVLSGLEVARALRRRKETAHAYLIALTGWGQPEDRREAQEAGFDIHLTKPTDADELLRALARVEPRARD